MMHKSRGVSLALTILFGPLGLLYSTIAGAVILTFLAIISAVTVVGPLVCWVLAIAIGDHATHRYNEGINEWVNTLKRR